ncbi:hypothetical protein HZA33_03810 [Candidatus Pacearchaeota archaeon]|nr:hypothetical protein [Candidatus Pacearchaeota archaeon]
MVKRAEKTLEEKVSKDILEHRIGFDTEQNLAGQLNLIFYRAGKHDKLFNKIDVNRKYSPLETIERIQYTADRLEDETGKTQEELAFNVGIHVKNILEYGRYFADLIETKEEILRCANLLETAGEYVPIVRVMNCIIDRAIKDNASLIDIEKSVETESTFFLRGGIKIFYTINGEKQNIMTIPLYCKQALYDTFKILTKINPAFCKKDAEGKAQVKSENKIYELNLKYFGQEQKISAELKFLKEEKIEKKEEKTENSEDIEATIDAAVDSLGKGLLETGLETGNTTEGIIGAAITSLDKSLLPSEEEK